MSINQLISQSISQPVSHQPVGQSIIQPVSLSVSPAVSKSVSKPVSQSASQWVSQWFWSKIANFLFVCFRKKIGLEVVFDDYLVRKEVVLDYKNIDFKQWPYCFFSKGSTHDFGRKMEIPSLYVFGQMDLEILFDDHWGRKHALLDYKILDITKLPCWDFFIGVNPRFFWQKKSRNKVWWSSS